MTKKPTKKDLDKARHNFYFWPILGGKVSLIDATREQVLKDAKLNLIESCRDFEVRVASGMKPGQVVKNVYSQAELKNILNATHQVMVAAKYSAEWKSAGFFVDENELIVFAGEMSEKGFSVRIIEFKDGMPRDLPGHWEALRRGAGVEFVFVKDRIEPSGRPES